ncbi:ImmA/IrrE family metallo-endopeptidase [Weissella viridescens]|uniref:ImmA/IrrE family metallo-endopeptidase n=1 Tax=Weissella viridescens TaxID=1629 RepID=UPI003AA91228
MNNSLPEFVVVNGIEYRIATIEEIDNDPLINGTIYYDKQLIHIKSSLATQRKKQVLVHEFMHALFYEAGIEETEEVVDILSRVLYSATKKSNETRPMLNL